MGKSRKTRASLFGKTKGNRKRRNKKSKRTLSHKRKQTKKRTGGELLGKGSYGEIYGNPRFLCEGEKIGKSTEGVSKIFTFGNKVTKDNAEFEANKEYNVAKSFETDSLSNFCVFPRRMCDITENKLNEHLVTEQKRKMNLSNYAKSMVIYDKGDSSGWEKIIKMKTMRDFVECLQLLTNVVDGIQEFQEQNINHGDIRWGNCVVIDDKLKMIDLGDLQKFDEMKYPTLFTDFSYFALTPLVIFFDECGNSEIITHSDYIAAFYKNGSNPENYGEGVKNSYNMFVTLMGNIKTLLPDKLPIIQTLMIQKTFFNDKGEFDREYKIEDWVKIINKLKRSYSNDNSPKIKILKRIDVYSFGVMIIVLLNVFFENVGLTKTNRLLSSFILLYVEQLIKIIDDCCNCEKFDMDFSDILEKYYEFVGSMNALIPPESVPSSVSSLSSSSSSPKEKST